MFTHHCPINCYFKINWSCRMRKSKPCLQTMHSNSLAKKDFLTKSNNLIVRKFRAINNYYLAKLKPQINKYK